MHTRRSISGSSTGSIRVRASASLTWPRSRCDRGSGCTHRRRGDGDRSCARHDRAGESTPGTGQLAGRRLPVAAVRGQQLRRGGLELWRHVRARPQRAAAELSRVCRGRLAITAWIADPGRDLWQGCAPTCTASRVWSSETSAARLLPSFDLGTEERIWWLHGHSGEAIWSWVLHLPTRSRAPAAALGRGGP